MREIKCRGKRKDNGEWVYGHYISYSFLGRVLHYIVQDFSDHCQLSERLALVDPATVGQYTGLKDKNGKEIYEGPSKENNRNDD